MSYIWMWLMALSLVVLLGACERRHLEDADDSVEMSIDVDTDIPNEDFVPEPEMMRLYFYNSETGALMTEHFLTMPRGLLSVPMGRFYNIMTFNHGTHTTYVESLSGYGAAYATTNEVQDQDRAALKLRADSVYYHDMMERIGTAVMMGDEGVADTTGTSGDSTVVVYEKELISYEPDHLFVDRLEEVFVPVKSEDDGSMQIPMYARTILETWKISLKIVGVEFVSSVSAVVTNMAKSKNLITSELIDTTSLYIERIRLDMGGNLDAVFSTFGFIPEARSIFSLVITDTGGEVFVYDFPLYGEFMNQVDRTVDLDEEIVVEKPEHISGGGLAPDVDDWVDEEIGIEIGK